MGDEPGKRGLPRSLVGLEKIMTFLDGHVDETFSMRAISDATGISTRVATNALQQLERLGQVCAVAVEHHVLPKWKITRLGREAARKARDEGSAGIADGLDIPDDAAVLAKRSREARSQASATLRDAVVASTRLLASATRGGDPRLAEVARFLLARVKAVLQRVSALPSDPLAVHVLKRAGEKGVTLSGKDETYFHVEVHFFSSLLARQATRVLGAVNEAVPLLDDDADPAGAGDALDRAREEMRRATRLVHDLESVKPRAGMLAAKRLAELAKNHVDPALVREVLVAGQHGTVSRDAVRRFVLDHAGAVQSGKVGDGMAPRESLVAFWNRLLDELPHMSIGIEDLERTINAMADEGLVPGITTIELDGGGALKVVDFSARVMTAREVAVVRHAMALGTFTLADMVATSGLDVSTVAGLLDGLVEQGVLGHSKTYVHGDRWHARSAAPAGDET